MFFAAPIDNDSSEFSKSIGVKMKKQYVCSILLGTALTQLVGCSGPGSSANLSSGNVMSGTAATGAPISGGAVKVKGSNGVVVEETTSSDGSYSANVASLTEPYLVQVISPSGEKYISVASQSALASGKKINVTPLTHTIVANVFGNSDGDEIFANFETESSNFSEAKLKEEKDELVQKFINAGLLGSGKIANANLDLLNGSFVAGSGVGIDGLLDVISVNTDGAAGIEIGIKGEATLLFRDKVDGTSDTIVQATAIDTTRLNAAKEQLSVLDLIRARMNALASLHSSYVKCNDVTPVDDNSECGVDTVATAFAPFFHSTYQEDGNSGDAGIYSWICRKDNDDDAVTKNDCLASGSKYEFENVSLKDISLIKYDAADSSALISFNIYMNGTLKGSEEMELKYDAVELKYDLVGNKKTFRYWIETEALHSTEYNKTTNTGVDTYSVNLNFHANDLKGKVFSEGQALTLTATSQKLIFPGGVNNVGLNQMSIYMVTGPSYDNEGVCSKDKIFSVTATPYKVFDPNTGATTYANYATACGTADPCQPNACTGGYFDYEIAQKLSLSAQHIANMNKVEKITMTGGPISGDEFIIKKPLVINEYNAATYVPSFGMSSASFCEDVTFATSLSLSVNTGVLNYANIHHGYSLNNQWNNVSDKADFWDLDQKSGTFSPSFQGIVGGEVIHYSHLYLSARDEFDRQFVRRVNCSAQQNI
jgi:hypothetical protein